jgi:CheY-like chemotaxis protein
MSFAEADHPQPENIFQVEEKVYTCVYTGRKVSPTIPMAPTFQVLVVEDDPGTRTLFRAVLERLGLTVTPAADGEEALERLGEQWFDAVVLDLFMHGTDGVTVIRELLSIAPEMLHRVVVVTAASAAYLRGVPELEHVAAVIRKPLDIAELGAEVLACVAASAADRNLRAASGDHRLAN